MIEVPHRNRNSPVESQCVARQAHPSKLFCKLTATDDVGYSIRAHVLTGICWGDLRAHMGETFTGAIVTMVSRVPLQL